MKKILLMITDYFPYGWGETFIESEIVYLSKSFEKIVICPLNAKSQKRERLLPVNCIVINNLNKEKPWLSKILGLFYSGIAFFEEIILGLPLSLNPKVFVNCLRVAGVAGAKSCDLKNILMAYSIDIIYSYWMTSGALAAVLVKMHKNVPVISRVHGYDLYAERYSPQYVPFQRFLVANLNKICAISDYGAAYLKSCYPKYQEKILTYRLGVIKGEKSRPSNDKIFRIVSCSNLIPLKRVDIIANALKLIKFPILWIHFGDGVERSKIEKIILTHPSNVHSRLVGQVDNKIVLKYYEDNPVDLFITTSSTEGCPVSIQEAASRGIPVMATKVGGIPEIVYDNVTGLLLPVDITPEKLAQEIKKLHSSQEILRKYSENIYNIYIERFDASCNYPSFIGEVLYGKY